jgi:signal transduction histidine kinase
VVRDISWPLSNVITFPRPRREDNRWRPGQTDAAAGMIPAARPGGWPLQPAWPDLAWAGFLLLNLAAILIFQRWETIPFHLIWISVTLLYGFRIWSARPALWVLAAVSVSTFAAVGADVWRHRGPAEELTEVPLMAVMFWAMAWHARRRLAADTERARVSEENGRLLATQRRFLQDASHQLRTPITIALGHAELLARELAGQKSRDIHVVVGELTRLKGLGDRLLTIAASQNPDFFRPEPVDLSRLIREAFLRWQPTAKRDWQLGQLSAATVRADPERLGLAVDALLENAVQHTGPGDLIRLSVSHGPDMAFARIVIEDGGTGIRSGDVAHIFDRFRTGSNGTAGGTGLGLALVRSIARGHHGEIRVRSTPGTGSRFDLMLPAMTAAGEGPAGHPAPAANSAGERRARTPAPAMTAAGELPAGRPAPAQAGEPHGTWTQR